MKQQVPAENLDIDPEFAPPHDERLIELLMQQRQGKLDMFYATVPLKYIRPFSPTYKPEEWQFWRPAVEAIKKLIESQEDYPVLVTYQVGDFMVMSDDYPDYYAYLELNLESAPCYVLGEPQGNQFLQIQRLPGKK